MRRIQLPNLRAMGSMTVAAALLALSIGGTAGAAAPGAFVASWPFVQGAPINEFNNNGLPFYGMDVEPLAFSLTNTTQFRSALAQSWKLSSNGRILTVTLRPNARWSNGQPVTAADVKAAWAVMGIEGWWSGEDIAQVNVTGPRTLQFVRFPTPSVLFEYSVLTEGIESPFAFEQHHLLPPNIWSLIDQSNYAGNNPSLKKLASKAGSQLGQLGVKVSALAPKTDVSDGPWKLTSVNAGEEIWQRNPYFFHNAENHINTVVMRNQVNNQVVFNWMMAGQIDYASTAMPVNVKQAALRVAGNKFVNQSYAQFCGLSFDEHYYPFNLVQVRQALAYAINRSVVQRIGEPTSGTPSKYLTGMEDNQAQQWVPKNVLNSLNPYNYDPATAAGLLKTVGFKKVGGHWMLPDGKPFTLKIQVEAGFSDYDEVASVVENELDAFGIPTKVYQVNLAQYSTDQEDGDYAVSFQPLGGNDVVYPQAAYDWIYFEYDGWEATGTAVKRLPMGNIPGSTRVLPRQFDIPTTLHIPGLGKVDPGPMTQKLLFTSSKAQQMHDFGILAKTTNYWVPVLPLFNQYQSIIYSTSRWTDWPAPTSYLQNLNNTFEAWMFWAQYGWLKPR